MSSTTTVSASAHLHLAPSSPPDYSRDEIRRLVLEYLCSNCYIDSAKAFAQETKELAVQAELYGEALYVGERERSKVWAAAEERVARERNGDGVAGSSRRNRRSSNVMEGIESTPASVDLTEVLGVVPGVDDAMEEEDDGVLSEDLLPLSEGMHSHDLNPKELRTVRLRRDIRDAILVGRVNFAVDLINEHFPSVLAPVYSLPPLLNRMEPQDFFVSTPPITSTIDNSSNGSLSQVPVLGASFREAALSLNPEILSLNLQLQSFVELIRAANSTSTPSTPIPHPNTEDSPSENGMSTSTSSILSVRTGSMMKAIAHSQALGAKVRDLPAGKAKESWEKECVDVSGLMAYTDLTICPVRGYLAQSRRETLAELVNSAILKATDRTPISLLALAARQTTGIWSALAEWKVPFPPGTSKAKLPKTIARFDLHTYLLEGEPLPSPSPDSKESEVPSDMVRKVVGGR